MIDNIKSLWQMGTETIFEACVNCTEIKARDVGTQNVRLCLAASVPSLVATSAFTTALHEANH